MSSTTENLDETREDEEIIIESQDDEFVYLGQEEQEAAMNRESLAHPREQV